MYNATKNSHASKVIFAVADNIMGKMLLICKWNSLEEQECLNEASFLFYAGCTEGCVPAFFSPPLTDTVIPLTPLCLVEKSSHISSFFFGFPGIQSIFTSLEILKWQPKQGIVLESALQTTSNACVCCRATNCSAGPHKGTDLGRAGYREHKPSQNAIPRVFSKYSAKPVIANYSISLGLYLGGLCYILGLRSERRMQGPTNG